MDKERSSWLAWYNLGSHRTSVRSAVSTTLRLNDTVGNSDVAHRILVNDAVDTELTSINCVKSSADKDNFNDAERKSKTNVVSLHN